MSPTSPPRPSRSRLARRRLLAALGLLAVAAARPLAAAETDAASFIQRVGDQTVAILARPGATSEERLRELVDVLNRATDLDLVGRLVLGQYWRTASDEQRREYTKLFRELVVKTMADRLNWYGGETFEITGQRALDDRDTVVATKIFRPTSGGQPISVDWRVRKFEGRWSIIDIVAEGISMVVTQRSEVGSVVSQKGMDGLIATMRERLQGRA